MKSAPSDGRPRRYQLLLPLRVLIRGWGRGKRAAAAPQMEEESITQNISSSGCYFLMDKKPKVGSTVEMEIKMSPDQKKQSNSTVVCRGRVVRTQPAKGTAKTGVACAFERYRIVPAEGSEQKPRR